MSKINTSKIKPKIRIRFRRSWRGYRKGAVIAPPAGMRQILLQQKDQLGNQVAELADEPEQTSKKPEVSFESKSEKKPAKKYEKQSEVIKSFQRSKKK